MNCGIYKLEKVTVFENGAQLRLWPQTASGAMAEVLLYVSREIGEEMVARIGKNLSLKAVDT